MLTTPAHRKQCLGFFFVVFFFNLSSEVLKIPFDGFGFTDDMCNLKSLRFQAGRSLRLFSSQGIGKTVLLVLI